MAQFDWNVLITAISEVGQAAVTGGFGYGSAKENANAAKTVAGINAIHGNSQGGVSAVPQVVYQNVPAQPQQSKMDKTTQTVIYGLGGVIVLSLVIGAIVWGVRKFSKPKS